MSRIIVLGAGVCGLAAGMILRRDGHEVTVLDSDAEAVPVSPDEAWEDWPRAGDPGFVERILELARDRDPPPLAGPNRAQLLALLAD